jgi:O-antigen ligase
MKYAIFLLALAVVVPLGLWLRARPARLVPALLIAGALPFLGLDRLDINFFSQEFYRGDSKGFEVTALDLLVLALAIAVPRGEAPAPYRWSRWLYLAAAAVPLAWSGEPILSMFFIWKLLRMYVLVAVVARATRTPALAASLLRGMALGVVIATCVSLGQRYLHGTVRATGLMAHPNSLGMAVNTVFPVALAVLLGARGRTPLAGLAVLGAAICVVLSLSRGSMAMLVLGGGLVTAFSLARSVSRRKLQVLGLGAAGALALLARSADTIIYRLRTAPEDSVTSRFMFNDIARAMAAEHPLGIGANQFSHALVPLNYAERFGVPAIDGGAIAHHIYLLTLAELGWFGLVAYLLVLIAPLALALRAYRRAAAGTLRGDLLLGCAVALSVMYVHGLAEWIARQTSSMYLFWMVAGLVAGLAAGVPRQPREEPRRPPEEPSPSRRHPARLAGSPTV